jgi:hypothetical protein
MGLKCINDFEVKVLSEQSNLLFWHVDLMHRHEFGTMEWKSLSSINFRIALVHSATSFAEYIYAWKYLLCDIQSVEIS